MVTTGKSTCVQADFVILKSSHAEEKPCKEDEYREHYGKTTVSDHRSSTEKHPGPYQCEKSSKRSALEGDNDLNLSLKL